MPRNFPPNFANVIISQVKIEEARRSSTFLITKKKKWKLIQHYVSLPIFTPPFTEQEYFNLTLFAFARLDCEFSILKIQETEHSERSGMRNLLAIKKQKWCLRYLDRMLYMRGPRVTI